METTKLELGDVSVDVLRKPIKNVHLSVHPPTGRVRIAAPERMSLDTIRVFAISKLGWIKQHQRKVREQDRESPRDYVDRESHYVWGRRYLLRVEECDSSPGVEIGPSRLVLRVRPDTTSERREAILDRWYRDLVRETIPPLLETWEKRLGIKARAVLVQRLKTKWGSCTPATATIRLNTDLAKKPRECLEYILVHELAHLIEPAHNERFVAILDAALPRWRSHRAMLNRLPVRHEDWVY
jgi:predicted metal-dependent hydrolase